MKILVVHNEYQQPGGEDVVVRMEINLLKQAGHQIIHYRRANEEMLQFGYLKKLALPIRLIWASDSLKDLRMLMRKEKFDIAHFHNTFLMISPAAYTACRDYNVPVVQTLHNYRLLCPRADFYCNKPCEVCLGKLIAWPGVWRGCYRKSKLQTAAVAGMLMIHRLLQTWPTKVDIFIALTEFGRDKFTQGGLPGEKVAVKPNFFASDLGFKDRRGDFAIFVGRLSPEKGMSTLLNALRKESGIRLKVVGTGSLDKKISEAIVEYGLNHVEMLGHRSHEEVISLIKEARFLIFPSETYEGFPMTIVEAFACGTPVIASKLGAMNEIIQDHYNGLHFTPGDVDELSNAIHWAWTHKGEMEELGENARRTYEEKYSAEKNYEVLMSIYRQAIRNHSTGHL